MDSSLLKAKNKILKLEKINLEIRTEYAEQSVEDKEEIISLNDKIKTMQDEMHNLRVDNLILRASLNKGERINLDLTGKQILFLKKFYEARTGKTIDCDVREE